MLPRSSRPLTACTRMPSHFHSAMKSAAFRVAKSVFSIACASFIVRVLVDECCGSGLCQPRRDPDPHRAGDEFQQRPAAGLDEFIEPARQLLWQLDLAEGAK